MGLFLYAWATGADVALASLTNVEDDLAPYMEGRIIAPRSQPVQTFSEENESLDNWITQDGGSSATWIFDVLTRSAVNYIEDTYMGTGESAAVTIYTRRHNQEAYTRYNANIAPFNFPDDGAYEKGKFVGVRVRFTGLEAL